MAIIQGSKVAFQILIGDTYKTVMCAKSINLRTEVDVKEITTKGDGRQKDYDYDQLSASVTLDSVTLMQNNDNPVHFDFLDWQYQFISPQFRIIYTDSVDVNKIKVFRAQAVVRDTATNASAAQVVDGNVTLLVKSGWALEDAIPDFSNFRIHSSGNDAAAVQIRVQLVKLDTDDIIFDSALQPQAVANWLENPFDFTFDVLKGTYYPIIETRSETDTNTWVLTPSTTLNGSFDSGIVVYNGKTAGNVTRDFSIDRDLAFTIGTITIPPDCVDVQITGTPSLPDGVVGQAYSYSFAFTGTNPVTVSNVTKPSWLHISVNNITNTVTLSGTPDTAGTGVAVSFDLTNCSDGVANFSDTINVTTPPDTIEINYTYTENLANGTFRLYVNGTQVVFLNANDSGTINVNPGDTIQAVATPGATLTASLFVEDSIDGTLHFSTGAAAQSFTWVATSGHDYIVQADIDL